MASGDRFELVLTGTCIGQNTRNVFYYSQTNGAVLAAAIVESEFSQNALQSIRAIVTTATEFTQVDVKNLDNPEDFVTAVFSPPQAGNIDDQTLPPFVAWSFIYSRATLLSRNGWKRFAGVPELWQSNGTILDGTPTTGANSLAVVLESPLADGLGTTLVPVIMRKTRQPEDPSEPFESFLYEEFPIAGVDFKHIGSQNSRKF